MTTDSGEGALPQAARTEGDAERSRLMFERDDLLRSIRDLDREHEFGDLDDEDHARLRDEYTVAAAEVLRALSSLDRPDGSSSPHVETTRRESVVEPSVEESRPIPRTRPRVIVVIVVLMVFAIASGVMVARSAGQRGSNAITGSSGSLREQLATCQPLAFSSPAEGVECYAKILEKAPDNVEALTYQGWAMVRAGDIADAGVNFARVVELDPDYPDVRVFRAVVAVRAQDFATAADEVDRFYRNDPPDIAVQVLQSEGLEREIFFGLQPAPVRNCWQTAAEAGEGSTQLDAAFYGALGECLDGILEADPDDVDALVSRGFAAAGSASLSGGSTIVAATSFVDRALAVEPDNANALVLRAGLNAVNGLTAEAQKDLSTLDALKRPTISFLTGSPAQIADGL